MPAVAKYVAAKATSTFRMPEQPRYVDSAMTAGGVAIARDLNEARSFVQAAPAQTTALHITRSGEYKAIEKDISGQISTRAVKASEVKQIMASAVTPMIFAETPEVLNRAVQTTPAIARQILTKAVTPSFSTSETPRFSAPDTNIQAGEIRVTTDRKQIEAIVTTRPDVKFIEIADNGEHRV
ncbi:MAG: hypothetical protein GY727_00450, partial [Gammaproteobacteria bacterium]|nr:hypothetical protein [Gammaproteobacteria bacterium]